MSKADRKLDLLAADVAGPGAMAGSGGGRPWLGVRFACAGAYLRVHRDRTGAAYVARCPRCAEQVRFVVGPGGSSERFFEVDCGARPR